MMQENTTRTGQKPRVLIKVKPHALSVSIEVITSFSFDKKGRLIGAYMDGINYKRGLDNSVLRKWSEYQESGKRRHRRKLSDAERREFFNRVTAVIQDIHRHRSKYEIEIPNDKTRAWEWVKKCLQYDFLALEAEADKFHQIYKPVTILPPDQYYALVLQITAGCSYNKCTFCNFYQDRRFLIKSPGQVGRHIEEVNKFFGESLGLRRSLFLADANALIIPQSRLLAILNRINGAYTIIPDNTKRREIIQRRRSGEVIFDGIYSFIDVFTGEHKSAEQFREMAGLGVRRAYIGMESGSKALLEFLNKPGTKAGMVDAVNKIKAGGVNVGVIVLIGAGGKQYSDQHIADTVDALNQMQLTEEDFIYFSDFYPDENTYYQERADQEGVERFNWEDLRHQEIKIRRGLRFTDPKRGPKITTYDIREFLY